LQAFIYRTHSIWFSAFSRSVALLRQSLRNAVLQTLPNTHPGFNTRIALDNNLRCCNFGLLCNFYFSNKA